jgi:hypothetical protein
MGIRIQGGVMKLTPNATWNDKGTMRPVYAEARAENGLITVTGNGWTVLALASDVKFEVECDQCGKRHEATPVHVSPTQGQIFAVVCEDGLTDYYTSERLVY